MAKLDLAGHILIWELVLAVAHDALPRLMHTVNNQLLSLVINRSISPKAPQSIIEIIIYPYSHNTIHIHSPHQNPLQLFYYTIYDTKIPFIPNSFNNHNTSGRMIRRGDRTSAILGEILKKNLTYFIIIGFKLFWEYFC